jgi:hypothetical protein
MPEDGNFTILNQDKFDTHAAKLLNDLMGNKELADVTLVAENQQLKAHKLILSSCSPFFRNIFAENPHQHPLIYLKGVSFENLQNVIQFVYQGEARVNKDKMNSFLEVGQELQIRYLANENNWDVLSNVKGIKPEKGDFDNGNELLCNATTESIQDIFYFYLKKNVMIYKKWMVQMKLMKLE